MQPSESSEAPRRVLLSRVRPLTALLIVCVAFGVGLATVPAGNRTAVALTSSCLGWAYFTCWSVSFYPQLVLNFERRSVVGLSFDYAALNAVGFACYSAFNLALFYSPSVRAAYEHDHGGHTSDVQANDVFFSLHAFVISSLLLVQIALYPRGDQRFSLLCKLALALLALAVPIGVLLAAMHACSWCSWLVVLYGLSYVKLAITLTKYLPQVYLNVRRRSTDGWNIDNVVLDFSGGALSLAQLILDAASSDDWSKVTGDPVKLGLGVTSMLFDTLFMIQHFVCYRGNAPHVAAHASAPLLLSTLHQERGGRSALGPWRMLNEAVVLPMPKDVQ